MNNSQKTPVPPHKTTIGSARDQTKEARHILDQMLIGVKRLSTTDRNLVVLTLRHASRELELAANKIQQLQSPTELEGLPASLALLAALRLLMPNNVDLRQRFNELVNELGKAA